MSHNNIADNKRKQGSHHSVRLVTPKFPFTDIHQLNKGSNNLEKVQESRSVSLNKVKSVNLENSNKKNMVVNRNNLSKFDNTSKCQMKVLKDETVFSDHRNLGNNTCNKRKQGNKTNNLSVTPQKLQYADISCKKNNGSNNWAKFKEAEKVGLSSSTNVKPGNTENSYKKSRVTDVYNHSKFKDLQITSRPHVKPLNDEKEVSISGQKSSGFVKHNGCNSRNKPFIKHNLKPKLTKCIGIDCEMVGVDEDAKTNMIARVSLVNSYGDCIYDKFVKPLEPVKDYRTVVSGVRPKDLENGEDFFKVQKDVADLLKGRTLVGHALKNDLTVLFLTHPRGAMRDTSRYKKFYEGFKSTPSLKKLTAKYLGVNIQEGEHSSVEDARAAMMLYMMFQKDWEAEFRRKRSKRLQTTDSKTHTFTCDDV